MLDCRTGMEDPESSSQQAAARRSARLALWTSLAVTVVAALLLHRFATPIPAPAWTEAAQDQELWIGVDFESRPEVALLRELVAVDTSAPPPGELSREAELADRIAARLGRAGIEATVERFGDGRANLWAIVEGAEPRAVVLHGHLDVESTGAADDWDHPPLAGVIEGPWLYGRGVFDMKSLLAAQLLAFEEVAAAAQAGRPPARSLMLLFTSSEETGSQLGTRWILAEHPELVARLGTVLTEGGVIEALGPRDVKYWGIEFAQKRFAFFELCAADRASLEQLRATLLARGPAAPPQEVAPEVQAFLAAYGPTRSDGRLHEWTREPERVARDLELYLNLTPFYRSLFHDNVFAFEPYPDPGGGWTMKTVAHLLPDSDVDAVLADRLPAWLRGGVAMSEPELVGTGRGSPIDHPDFEALRASVARRHPEASVGPYFLPVAATDARLWREAGLVAYGFSPYVLMPNETTGAGRPNEKLPLPAYLDGIATYGEAVRALVARASG